MRIVQVIHGFPPENMAGSEVYTYQLSKELQRRGHDVRVFCRTADPSMDEYAVVKTAYEGLPVCKINNTFRNLGSFLHTYRNDTIAGAFGRFLDEVKPDAVHFGHVTCLSTTCVHEAKRRNIRAVYTLHDYWLICPRGQFVKRDLTIAEPHQAADCVQCMARQLDIGGGRALVERLSGKPYFLESSIVDRTISRCRKTVARRFFSTRRRAIAQIRERTTHVREMCSLVDMFVAPSRFLRQKYIDFGIPAGQIVYSDYGFNTSYYSTIRRTSSEQIRFGYIGTLIPTKGVHVLIKAFNRLQDTRAELRIWGMDLPYDGVENYSGYLRGLARNPNISFMGKYDNREIAPVLSQMDMIVVPSIWYENSPLTIHEAFLAGLPVITSNVGGMAELVKEGKNGLLFEMGDDHDLARQIGLVLAQPDLLAKLGGNASSVKLIEEDAQFHEKLYRGETQQSKRR